ncbi:MAG: alkaline phosphatase [Desulfobacterales bacterium]|jgi:alkaline phosphatase
MRYLKYGVVLMTVLAITFAGASAFAKQTQIKNIIIMISDGWGYNHIDATNYYAYGATGVQAYEHFSCQMAMSTYMVPGDYDPDEAWASFDYVKSGATDSAAAATAMSTAEKTYGGAIGVDLDKQPLLHVLESCEAAGMSTGVVSSVEFSHATPAAFVAHNEARGNYADIANEIIYESACEVIMGAGAPDYDNSGVACSDVDPIDEKPDACMNTKYVGGDETWDDLTDDFMVIDNVADADGDGIPDGWKVIRSREEFQKMASGDTPARVIGLPYVYQTLQQKRGGDGYADPYVVPLISSVPTLEEMTKAALNVLDDDPDGLFLMVEGGAVDWASHANQSGRMIEEQIDFNNAVQAVMDWIKANSSWGETLLIVTGDHETGYLTGPDSDPTWKPIVNHGAGNLPGMQWNSGSHTNQLIPFFAKGCGAQLFKKGPTSEDPIRGIYIDNTVIADVIFEMLDDK